MNQHWKYHYPNSTSSSAQYARWSVDYSPQNHIRGHVLLSTTHRGRALRRLVAHLRKLYPDAPSIEAHFLEA